MMDSFEEKNKKKNAPIWHTSKPDPEPVRGFHVGSQATASTMTKVESTSLPIIPGPLALGIDRSAVKIRNRGPTKLGEGTIRLGLGTKYATDSQGSPHQGVPDEQPSGFLDLAGADYGMDGTQAVKKQSQKLSMQAPQRETTTAPLKPEDLPDAFSDSSVSPPHDVTTKKNNNKSIAPSAAHGGRVATHSSRPPLPCVDPAQVKRRRYPTGPPATTDT
ncbi:hypothetical protein DL546_007594 [Coniochaeta pulveracea]|uniref:Uncharacterized protein n=1 Tax=Coniochaeta pulveracea TaxID=177199 RepID=A0A420YMR0_9PEZI|nr:hypothetical protein DL546_007594 [Coniochaeta pulveracea]